MVSVTTVLQAGPPGPAQSCTGSPGDGLDGEAGLMGDLGKGTGQGCGAGFRNVCTVGEVRRGLCLGQSRVQIPRSGMRRGAGAQGRTHPEHKGRWGPGAPRRTPVSAFSPPAGAWE